MKPPIAHRAQAALPSPQRIALIAMVALGINMGIGRFIYTPLLPMMLDAGQVDLVQGGWLASVNNIGYFLGALLCAMVRIVSRQTIRVNLLAIAVLTACMGVMDGMSAWVVLRLLAGIATAIAFVAISGWCLSWLAQSGRGDLGGIMYAGPGLGIMVGGIAGAYMQAHGVSADSAWLWSAAITLAALLLVWAETGRQAPGTSSGKTVSAESRTPNTGTAWPKGQRTILAMHICCYGLAGFGYIITATFLPVMAEQALPGQFGKAWLWPLFGLSIAVGALLATRLPLHWKQSTLLGAAYIVQGTGVLMTVVFSSLAGFGLGSLLVGLPFTAITLFGMREARRLGGGRAIVLMGAMSAAYGLGQIIGPVLAAYLYDMTGGFHAALTSAAIALFLGAAGYFFLARREDGHGQAHG